MRFLCENCKAKYQIADEKLAGRAVRMKCRKCGQMIDVPALEPAAAAPVAQQPPQTRPASASAPKSGEAGPPRPAKAPSIAAPRVARPAPPSAAANAPVAPPRPAPVAPPSSAPGALAGAFQRTVRSAADSDVSAAIEVLSAGAGEEWYVGINGVPLGPVRLSAIRQKAAQGVINEDSLVWREGFEEWLPLRSFPELLTLLNEAREQSSRSSWLPAPAPSGRKPLSQPPPATGTGVPSARPAQPAIGSGLAEISPTVPLAPVGVDEDMATVVAQAPSMLAAYGQVTADPFAASGQPTPSPAAGAAMLAGPAPSARVELPMRPSVPPDDSMARRSLVEDLAVGVRRQVRLHPAAYVLIALAAGFGVTGAVVVFTGDKAVAPPPTIQVVTVAAPMPTNPGTPRAADSSGSTHDINEVAVAARTGAGGPVATPGAPGAAETAEPNKGTAGAPHVGLGDGPNVGGPAVGGPTPGGGSVAQLEQSDIERVVASQRSTVKRRCWDTALAARDPSAPPSAKVSVSVTIGSSGRVVSANASGGDGYPGLASCVQQRVMAWTFPPSSGESRANIPFAFFSQ